jgi:hypothetical protein
MPLFLTNVDLLRTAQKYDIPLRGIFSKDQPPQHLQVGGYIVNLENSHDSYGRKLDGSHWVAFWVEPNEVVYFDSFGFPPSWDTQHLLRRFVPYRYNRVQIQNVNSGICGYYALFFVWYMNQKREKYPNIHVRFNKFIKLFNSRNPTRNREILQNLLKNIKY